MKKPNFRGGEPRPAAPEEQPAVSPEQPGGLSPERAAEPADKPAAESPAAAPARTRRGRIWLHTARCLQLLPVLLSAAMLLLAVTPEGEAASWRTPYVTICVMTGVLSLAMAVLWKRLGRAGEVFRKTLQSLMVMVVPFACFYILELFTHNPLEIGSSIRLLNILFFYLLELIVLFICRLPAVACNTVLVLTAVLGIANNLATQARQIPVFPWDIASLGTALSVAGNYDFILSWNTAAALCMLSFLSLVSLCGSVKLTFGHLWMRIAAVVLSLACMGGYVGYLSTDRVWTDFPLYPYLFTPDYLYKHNGFAVSFLSSLKYLKIDKPTGYSESEIERFMAEYEARSAESAAAETPVKPNVIVLMNEAFSDLSVLTGGQPYWKESDPLEFYNSLTENTARGYAYVSVKGGNTANSEFEFLTGLSMAYLPVGSIPYQQYLKGETPSLAAQFSSLGYDTVAMHPFGASGWDRNKVYTYFGFDRQLFITDFYDSAAHYQQLRGYISDRSMVNKIIDLYVEQTKESDAPLFLFGVTMQNHGGYTDGGAYTNFTQTVHATGLEDQEMLTTYLSLLDYSDAAFQYLISRFQRVAEPTVIVMFGDHQPNDFVVDVLANRYGTDISSTITAQQQRYLVPYVMWANYDLEESEDAPTSLNYLAARLLQFAGLPLTPQQEFLTELQTHIPAINGNGFLSPDGVFRPITEQALQPMLNQYAMLQYDFLFDRKTALNRLFCLPD